MDIVAFSPRIPGSVYVDLTVVGALSVEAVRRGSALRDGVASEIAAEHKVAKYPNCQVAPFAVEDHGRFGESAVALIRALAPTEPFLRTAAIGHIYQSMSSTLQRIAADAVIAAMSG